MLGLKTNMKIYKILIINNMGKKPKKVKGQKWGKIVFNENLPHEYRQTINQLAKKINLNGFRWQVVKGLFQTYNLSQLLKFASEININHFGISDNNNPHIVSEISVIKYPKLQNLFLGGNNIQSIENLCSLDTPILWRINLRQNFIRDLKPLRKAYFPALVMLVIGQNEISEMKDIGQCEYPQLNWIDMENNKPLTHVLHCLKINSSQIGQFYATDSSMLERECHVKAFQRKWTEFKKGKIRWTQIQHDISDDGFIQ